MNAIVNPKAPHKKQESVAAAPRRCALQIQTADLPGMRSPAVAPSHITARLEMGP